MNNKDTTIYVKTVFSYQPTEIDEHGCDGLYVKLTEIIDNPIAKLETEVTELRAKLAIANEALELLRRGEQPYGEQYWETAEKALKKLEA